MALDELKRSIMAVPFRPFMLNIADGRRIPVIGRDFIITQPEKGRTVVVFHRDGSYDLLDGMLITDVTFEATADAAAAN